MQYLTSDNGKIYEISEKLVEDDEGNNTKQATALTQHNFEIYKG